MRTLRRSHPFWSAVVAAAALAVVLSGQGEASQQPSPADSTAIRIASTPSDSRDHQLDVIARKVGIPASVLLAAGLSWLIFSQGKQIQENKDAWGKLLQGMKKASHTVPIPEAADPGSGDAAAAPPLPLLQPPTNEPWWPPSRRTAAALLAGTVVALPLLWILGRPQLARWQLQRGDEAFLAFAKVPDDEARLDQAGAAWQRAKLLDPRLAAAHARLGFLADFLDDPVTAEAAWKRARDLERPGTAAARAYRNGLANVLAQQPARRQEALKIYDGDNDDPRSAVEAAMQRWPRPAELPFALDAASKDDLAASLAGKASGGEPPWGFKMPDGELLLFETRSERRCLLAGVRAATAHLAGETAPAPPLAAADCQGIQSSVKDLLCGRLEEARSGNPRAAATALWLGCTPPATGTPATDVGTAS